MIVIAAIMKVIANNITEMIAANIIQVIAASMKVIAVNIIKVIAANLA